MKVEDLSPRPLPGRQHPVIALIGSDGSGKSTIGEALLAVMTVQRPTALFHLGKQAGNLGRSLEKLPFIGSHITKKTHKEEKRRTSGKAASLLAVLVGFALSIRRVVRFAAMRRKHREGFAILTDRYPQDILPGPMDGPGLADLQLKGHLAHGLMRLERLIYSRMCRFTPDLVIRLNVDIETAMLRKPDHLRYRLERKIADVAKLSFNSAPILNLSATDPLENVLRQAKEAVGRVFSAYPLTRPGVLIALVGCDGSGKSSLSNDLVQSLASKRPAQYRYLGLGSGELGRWIGTWPIIGHFLEKKLTSKAKKTRTKGEKIPGLLTALVVFVFSLLRYKRFLDTKKAVNEGYLVITDRYPQAEIAGQCDGPGLSAARTHHPLVWLLSRLETRLYQKMASFRPDLVIFLKVDAETAHKRKSDHDIEALRIKTDIMPRLTFDHAPHVTIDATQAYLIVKQEILDQLQNKGLIL